VIVSSRIAELLRAEKIRVNQGRVIFKTFDKEYEYFILQAEPQSVWTEAERQKWDLIVCTVCGSALRKKSGGPSE
jgi:hypothetical protein